MLNRIRNALRAKDGMAAVEFALLAPVLVAMLVASGACSSTTRLHQSVDASSEPSTGAGAGSAASEGGGTDATGSAATAAGGSGLGGSSGIGSSIKGTTPGNGVADGRLIGCGVSHWFSPRAARSVALIPVNSQRRASRSL